MDISGSFPKDNLLDAGVEPMDIDPLESTDANSTTTGSASPPMPSAILGPLQTVGDDDIVVFEQETIFSDGEDRGSGADDGACGADEPGIDDGDAVAGDDEIEVVANDDGDATDDTTKLQGRDEKIANGLISILNAFLKDLKNNVLKDLLKKQKKKAKAIPDIPMDKISNTLYRMQPKKLADSDVLDPVWAADCYCTMIAFMALYKAFLEVFLTDLVAQGPEDDPATADIAADDENVLFGADDPGADADDERVADDEDDLVAGDDDELVAGDDSDAEDDDETVSGDEPGADDAAGDANAEATASSPSRKTGPLVNDVLHHSSRNQRVSCETDPLVNDFLHLFAKNRHVLSDPDDPFTWFYAKRRASIVARLSGRIRRKFGTGFASVKYADTILTRFYSGTLLKAVAWRHQKDLGQFYTPQCVVDFMWWRCFREDGNADLLAQDLPFVLDPCMGNGSFLCSYLVHLLEFVQKRDDLWNNGAALCSLFARLPGHLWGVELDPFIHRLGKLNVILHLFPFFKKCVSLGVAMDQIEVERLCLLCNDTLLLTPPDEELHPWEHQQVLKLRDPALLQFDYIVTNPPYMTRRSGFFKDPDTELYNMNEIGQGCPQIYVYFIWFALKRLNQATGLLCFITPIQWLRTSCGTRLRQLIWKDFVISDGFMFATRKIWPQICTDSLIFTTRKRQQGQLTPPTIFVQDKHANSTKPKESLKKYYSIVKNNFLNAHELDLVCKVTPTDNLNLLSESWTQGTLACLFPSCASADRLDQLTHNLPRLINGPDSPLSWSSGATMTPIYGSMVRTEWARSHFKPKEFEKLFTPAFYWSWKKIVPEFCDKAQQLVRRRSLGPVAASSSDSSDAVNISLDKVHLDKDMLFWNKRDPARLTRKQWSNAESYVPLPPKPGQEFSALTICRKDIRRLGRKSRVFQYVKDMRDELRPQSKCPVLTPSFFNCGSKLRFKIVHPTSLGGYFINSSPRPRFFLDVDGLAVSNQCFYFTLTKNETVRKQIFDLTMEDNGDDAEETAYLFFLGLCNSSVMRFLTYQHCRYDVNCRLRFHQRNLARIPYAPPTAIHVQVTARLVDMQMELRKRIFGMVNTLPDDTTYEILKKVRLLRWDVDEHHANVVNKHVKVDVDAPVDTAVGFALSQGGGTAAERLVRLLSAQSLIQHAIDHVFYDLYKVSGELALKLEREQHIPLIDLWMTWQVRLHECSPLHLAIAILDCTMPVNAPGVN
ncbi:hypothetical protein BC940DRAFT_330979 [Gongronella butleri]|nr:hypothetical protein BC940DRAFT_330979 [Gongronella butleri]